MFQGDAVLRIPPHEVQGHMYYADGGTMVLCSVDLCCMWFHAVCGSMLYVVLCSVFCSVKAIQVSVQYTVYPQNWIIDILTFIDLSS